MARIASIIKLFKGIKVREVKRGVMLNGVRCGL
jgi:hypothetical protein